MTRRFERQCHSRRHDRVRHARAGLTAVAAALACFHASATDESKTFLTKPLLLEDFGSFYIGGIPKVTDFSATPIPSDTPPDLSNQYWVPIKDIWALRVRLQMQG